MDFEAVYTNGECYLLELKEGGAALVNLLSGGVDRSESVDKYLRLGVYDEIQEPLAPEVLERLDCLLHDRPLPQAAAAEGPDALEQTLERLRKDLAGLDYVTFRAVDLSQEEDLSFRRVPPEKGTGKEET